MIHSSRIRQLVAAAGAALCVTGSAAALTVGQPAPDFTLTAPGGKAVTLTDLVAKGPVVVYTFLQVASGV